MRVTEPQLRTRRGIQPPFELRIPLAGPLSPSRENRFSYDRTALLLVDVQRFTVERGGRFDREARTRGLDQEADEYFGIVASAIANLVTLIEWARAIDLRVVHLRQLPLGRADGPARNSPLLYRVITPETEDDAASLAVTEAVPGEAIVHRVGLGLHRAQTFQDATEGVTLVLLAGALASTGCEAVAREALDRGYSVIAIADAITDRTLEIHHYTMQRLASMGVAIRPMRFILGLRSVPGSGRSGRGMKPNMRKRRASE